MSNRDSAHSWPQLTGLRLSVAHGNPPLVKSAAELSALDAPLRNNQVPPRLAFQAEVQRCIARYHDLLLGKAEAHVRETLVQMCEQELDSLVERYRGAVDGLSALYFHTTQLHLYALASLGHTKSSRETEYLGEQNQATRYQKLGTTAAHRFIDIYCNEVRSPDNRLIDVYRALPKQYFIGLLLATFMLLRYVVLNPACEAEQKTASRNKVLMVHAKLQEFTSHQFAEPGRAAAVIEVLCRHGEARSSDANEDIDDRGVASISWSALIAAANLRGKRSLKTIWLEKINPASQDLRADQRQSTPIDVASGVNTETEPTENEYPIPDNIWDQSFLQMLDFSAYDLDETST